MNICPESIVVSPESIVVNPESIVVNPESIVVNPESIVVSPESIEDSPESIVISPEPNQSQFTWPLSGNMYHQGHDTRLLNCRPDKTLFCFLS